MEAEAFDLNLFEDPLTGAGCYMMRYLKIRLWLWELLCPLQVFILHHFLLLISLAWL